MGLKIDMVYMECSELGFEECSFKVGAVRPQDLYEAMSVHLIVVHDLKLDNAEQEERNGNSESSGGSEELILLRSMIDDLFEYER